MSALFKRPNPDVAHVLSEWWTPEGDLSLRENEMREGWDPATELLEGARSRMAARAGTAGYIHSSEPDFPTWRSNAKSRIISAIGLDPGVFVKKAVLRECIAEEGVIREELVLQCSNGRQLPASLLRLSHLPAPAPAIIALHCMGGMRAYGRERLFGPGKDDPEYLNDYRKMVYGGQSPVSRLVQAGYVVLAIDAIMFGERTEVARRLGDGFANARRRWTTQEVLDAKRRTALEEQIAVSTEALTGRSLLATVIEDDMACIDYLTQRADVDGKRIGCFGLSFGAYRTHYLAGLDERVGCAVSVCWLSSLRGVVGYNVGGAIGQFAFLPGMQPEFDLSDLPTLILPRPFLGISGWRDDIMMPCGIADAHRRLRATYRKAGCCESLGSLVFDSPHEFNSVMQERALRWFQRWL
jgi:hypothetical protein